MLKNPFQKKKDTIQSVADAKDGQIDGITGASAKKSKKPLSTKQKVGISVAVLAFVALVAANKIVGPAKPSESDSTQGIAPITQTTTIPAEKTSTAPIGSSVSKQVPPMAPVKAHSVAVTHYPLADAQTLQNMLSMASENTATLVQSWPGPGGLTGVIYRDVNGKEGVAWVNTQNRWIMIGTLLGENGKNYNTTSDFALAAQTHTSTTPVAATASAVPVAAASPLQSLMTGGTGFMEGSAGPEVTVFIDPNSAVGNDLYKDLALKMRTGHLRVRYVPVAQKNESSLHKAEEILAAPSPAKELRKDERLYHKSPNGQMSGGIRGVTSTLAMAQEVDGNTALLAAAGYLSNPVMVYCDKQGATQVSVGQETVGDLNAILKNLGTCRKNSGQES